jgi:hypothetical protein
VVRAEPELLSGQIRALFRILEGISASLPHGPLPSSENARLNLNGGGDSRCQALSNQFKAKAAVCQGCLLPQE